MRVRIYLFLTKWQPKLCFCCQKSGWEVSCSYVGLLQGPFPSIFVLFYFFLFIYWFKRYFLVVIRNFISLKSVSDSSLWAMELTNQLSIIISSFMVQFSFFNWFRIFWLSLLENQIFYFVYLFHCDQTVSKSFKYISAKSYVLGPLFDT